ncbi:MAG: NAD(P)-dependent oxidoreductase [Aquabacterium sp.]
MDILIVEPLDPEVMHWLVARHAVRFAPDLARDPRAFKAALFNARSVIIPPAVSMDAEALSGAPALRAVGRLSAGAENIDLEACQRARIEVVRPVAASASAEAEFMVGALLQMLRRVPVVSADGMRVGRELSGCVVGLVGMAPAAKPLAQLLAAFGAEVVGYDPALHANDALWDRWGVVPTGLRELLERSEATCVMLTYFTRYHGLLGERYLPLCRPNQVLVSIASSALFEEDALADALGSGRLAAAWLDSLEPGMLDEGRPLHAVSNLQITPRVASTTRESRSRSAWAVARRIDEILNPSAAAADRDAADSKVAPFRAPAAERPGPEDAQVSA